MKRSSRILGILCLIAVVAALAATGEVLANCQNEGPYPVRQCSTADGMPAWFAPKPADGGTIAATWWILGAGNRLALDPSGGASPTPVDGDGFIDSPNPGIFIGVDSGILTSGPATGYVNGGLDLVDAEVYSGSPLSAGGLCFSSAANWALPFVDGCSDQNRTYYALGSGGDFSDNYIDTYWAEVSGGVGTLSDYALVDAPMGVLLTESNNKYFAIAFFSSTNRMMDPNDIFDKGYDMGQIVNGDDNPANPAGNDNVIPWQLIPQPFIGAAIDPNTDRILSFQWQSIRIVRDNSSRASTHAGTDPANGLHTLGNAFGGGVVPGVGILDQPELVSYIVQSKPIVGVDCDANAPWTNQGAGIVPPIDQPGGTPLATTATVPQNTCVRLTVHFGRIPTATMQPGTTVPIRNANRFNAQAGNLGDLGYEVSSTAVKVGGTLLSDRPVLRSATMTQRNLVVKFETLGEIELRDFDVMARDRRGTASVVANVQCTECSSGVGAESLVEVPRAAVRTATSVFVIAHPSETQSNELEITRTTDRPRAPGRGTTGRR